MTDLSIRVPASDLDASTRRARAPESAPQRTARRTAAQCWRSDRLRAGGLHPLVRSPSATRARDRRVNRGFGRCRCGQLDASRRRRSHARPACRTRRCARRGGRVAAGGARPHEADAHGGGTSHSHPGRRSLARSGRFSTWASTGRDASSSCIAAAAQRGAGAAVRMSQMSAAAASAASACPSSAGARRRRLGLCGGAASPTAWRAADASERGGVYAPVVAALHAGASAFPWRAGPRPAYGRGPRLH